MAGMRVYKNRNHYFKNFRDKSYQLLVISSQLWWAITKEKCIKMARHLI